MQSKVEQGWQLRDKSYHAFPGQYLLQIRLFPKIPWADELGQTLLLETIIFIPPHPTSYTSVFPFHPFLHSPMTESCFASWKAALKTLSLIIKGWLFSCLQNPWFCVVITWFSFVNGWSSSFFLSWVERCFKEMHVKVLSSSACNWDLIWKYGLHKCNQVEKIS